LKGKILNVEKARFDKMLSSAEVGTLITALGCGIGREEFNPDKLRYHRIIIMTDADVDGSHIRTLLLTFFYRQMPEIVERGHIYIAQPPLYKVKKGKQERYVKDDSELNQHLLELAMGGAELYVNDQAPALTGEALEVLSNQYVQVKATIKRLARRYNESILLKLLNMPQLAAESTREQVNSWFTDLVEQLNATSKNGEQFEFIEAKDGDQVDWTVSMVITRHGVSTNYDYSNDFFSSGEYTSIYTLASQLTGLIEPGAYVKRGDKETPITSFKEAIEWLIKDAAKGQHIQRYKGLGEMNPDQLAETTMSYETRHLLQVKIEDAIAADEVFTTLMGDQVEPRREFIETNALNVSNLDV
jgi:DNA gyrase subunit B